jgi:short-subunit dehydrogenase
VRAELHGREIEVSCVMPTVVNTELTAGVGQKWVKPVEATDVADAVVEALEVPKFDVYVPKSNGALIRSTSLLPRAAAEWIGRAMGTDKLMTEVDHTARAAYEDRAAHSKDSDRAVN